MYKGVCTLGLGKFCSVFSNSEQFGDGFSRGIQHLFYEDYEKDLLRMAVTLNRFENEEIEYANVQYNGKNAPKYVNIVKEDTEELFDVYSRYASERNLKRKTSAYATYDLLVMEEEIENKNEELIEFMQYAYVFFNFDEQGRVKYNQEKQCIIWENSSPSKKLVIGLQEKMDNFYLSKEPKASAIVTLHKVLKEVNEDNIEVAGSDGLSGAIGKKILLPPGQKKVFTWFIIPCSDIDSGIELLEDIRKKKPREEAELQHKLFFKRSAVNDFIHDKIKTAYYRNLLAIKALNLKGVIPADVIGYYYSGAGTPTTYVRDSLMVARAFLYSGYFEEAKEIITYCGNLPFKRPGEFYQRYDAYGRPAEGQNNNIEHQLDSNGYFLSLVYQYFEVTGEVLINYETLKDIILCIKENQGYMGLVGPEGGVNEGVYGGAYITSTNMFIAGGLYNSKKLLKEAVHVFEDRRQASSLIEIIDEILKLIESGIASMWDNENNYYIYGYSNTCGYIVERYDTPQYFSILYGYPNTERIQKNNIYLLRNAEFHEDGIGYSQQAYHHGAWIFNTAACSQYNYFNGDKHQYIKKLGWILNHLNGFYLAPEAISAEKESICFNNPLNWACAEVVATIALPSHLVNKEQKME